MEREWLFEEEHRMFRDTLRRWVEAELAPHADEWEERGEFPLGLYRKAGELGFFAGQERSACLRASTEVDYTVFSGRDFEKLKKDQPLDAMKVLYAAAQLVANLIVAD